MAHFWKTANGEWRKATLGWVALFVASAVYDFIREGRGSLSGIQFVLLAAGFVALAPTQDEPKEPLMRFVFRSPRYFAGAVILAAAAVIFLYRVFRDILG